MDKSHRLPLSLTSEDYEAIGALAAHFSNVEFLVGAVIWRILNIPAYNGTLLTANMSLAQRFDLIIALLSNQHTDEAIIKCIKDVAIEFNKDGGITARRNRYVHAVWVTNADGSAHIFNFNKQGRLRSSGHDETASIEKTIIDMSEQASHVNLKFAT